jgi:hypothetical protein
LILCRVVPARAHHLHGMSARSDAVRETLHGKRHAVDFRRVGFGDDADAHDSQTSGSRERELEHGVLRGDGRSVTTG